MLQWLKHPITDAPFGNIIASWAIERYGRKKLLYCGMIGSIVALIGETVTVTYGLATKAGQALGVVFLFVHLISFATFLDATTFVCKPGFWLGG